jgi:SAM-dependent methyltransferase
MPRDDALRAYNDGYYDAAHGGAATDAASVGFHSGINRIRVSHVEEFLSSTASRVESVLEIGPGTGFFARHWLGRHPRSRYTGVESDRSMHGALQALGVSVHAGPETLPSNLTVDMVVLSHVLEHVPDPVAFLRAVTRPLRPAGVLFVEVPCRDWEHKNLDEPHLLFFDKPPMRRMLEGLGFRDVTVSYHGREISELRKPGLVRRVWEAVRLKLIARGFVAPFGAIEPGLEVLDNALERAAIRPFEAHREHARPSWWLRALAIKGAPAAEH